MFSLEKKVESFCAQQNKSLESFSHYDLCQLIKQDLQHEEIYLNILKSLRFGYLEAVMLPTVYDECIYGSNRGNIEKFEEFLSKNHIKKENFCKKQNELCEIVQQKYINGLKGKAVPVDLYNSKHPLNDSRILAEAFVAKSRLVTADTHFLRTKVISERNQEIVQTLNLSEELSKNLPIQILQFSKTRLYKSLKNEKSIN